jgi:NADH-quinone oxidoreductase subunit M
MNVVVLGLFSNNIQGLQGSIFLMVGHGLASSGLFFLVGCLYDRYRTRLITYYGGLFQTMPIFTFFFFLFTLTNFSFPGTCNFIGEFLILIGFSNSNLFVVLFVAFSSILTVSYSILLFNKIIFSSIKLNYIKYYIDLKDWEFDVLFYLAFLTIFFGLKPVYILQLSYFSSLNLLEFFCNI